MELKRTSIDVDPTLHKEMKSVAARRDVSLSTAYSEAAQLWIDREHAADALTRHRAEMEERRREVEAMDRRLAGLPVEEEPAS